MEKIMQYVRAGKGKGLIFLLAAAVVLTFFGIVIVKQIYSGFEPQFMLAADEFLPITVQNGKIVNPAGVYKKIDFKFGEATDDRDVLPIVFDTREAVSIMPEAKLGIFIMTDVVYVISANKIEKVYLPDGVWDKDNVKKQLDSFVSMFSLIIAVLMICFVFLFLLIKTIIIAWLSKFGLKAMQRNDLTDISMIMRMSALVVALLDVIVICVGFFYGFSLGILVKGLIAWIVVMGGLLKIQEQKN